MLNEEEKSEADQIIPIHAMAFFSIAGDGEFHQLLQYDYYDPKGYYSKLGREEFAEEIRKLWLNMQGYLEEETNKINQKRVYPQVKFCDIQHRGRRENPFITWIISFKGEFDQGLNIYETQTEEEQLEYDCYAMWEFPQNTKILKVQSKLYFDIFGNRIILWAVKDMKIGGFERIRFELP